MLSKARGFKSLAEISIIRSRCYYTNGKRRNSTSLYAKISPLGSPNLNITPELQKWVEMGKKVSFAELQRIIMDLRRRNRYTQALQVSEWMNGRGYTYTPVQHAVQLDLVGKVHGFQSAENYFNSLSEQDRTDKVYGALLHCYIRQRQTESALMHLKTMKEKGIALTSVAVNDIMCLYTNIGKSEEVPEIFNQMKENNVQPNNLSYRICINSFGVRSDIEGLEKTLNEMESDSHIVMDWNTYAVVANFFVKAGLKDKANDALKKAERRLDNKSGLGYNHLISLHAQLGNKDDVFRLWCLEKDSCKRCLNKDYINMLESLMRLGELEEAEKLLKEWESSGNCYDFRVPSSVIVQYIEKGLCKQAEILLRHLIKTGKESTPNIWGQLALGYIEKCEMDDTLDALKVAISLCDEKGKKLDDKVITQVLSLVGEKGCFEDIEAVVKLLSSAAPLEKRMYIALLNSHVEGGGKDLDKILDIMKADNCDADEQVLKILSLKKRDLSELEMEKEIEKLCVDGEKN